MKKIDRSLILKHYIFVLRRYISTNKTLRHDQDLVGNGWNAEINDDKLDKFVIIALELNLILSNIETLLQAPTTFRQKVTKILQK